MSCLPRLARGSNTFGRGKEGSNPGPAPASGSTGEVTEPAGQEFSPPARKDSSATGTSATAAVSTPLADQIAPVGRAEPTGIKAARFCDLPQEARDRLDKILLGMVSGGVAAVTSLGEALGRGEVAESPEEADVLKHLMPGLVKLVPAVHQGLLIRPLWKDSPEIHRIVKELEAAAETFDDHGHARLGSLAQSLHLWAVSFLELQELKTEDFEAKRRKAWAILRAAEDFGSEVQQKTLLLEPFLFMMAGEKALGERGGVTSGALMEQAAQAAAGAESELTEILQGPERQFEASIRSTYQGMVKLYGAVNRFTYARILFDQFDFDSLADETLDQEAQEAFKLLSAGFSGGDFLTLTRYSEALYHLLRATNLFAKVIQTVFHSTYTGSPKALRLLKREVREARRAVIQAGLEFRSLVDYCDDLSVQVNNVARLATPNGKDFGKFSGLVTAAVFLPTVLVLSFANGQYALGLDARTIFEYSLLLGLVSGFGLAALKFTPKGLLGVVLGGASQAANAPPQSPPKG